MNASICQILSEELIKFLPLCRGEESPSPGELGVGMELYGMIPCLMRGRVGEGFLQEDIHEVFVAFWDSLSSQAGSLGLSLLCQSL